MTDAQQISFNAGMVEKAKAFRLTGAQFAAIRNSQHPEIALQDAIAAFLWNAKLAELRTKMGCAIMPLWVERYISNAWTAHSADFMAAAHHAYALASVDREAA